MTVPTPPRPAAPVPAPAPSKAPHRISSGELMQGEREVEIDHAGRIYRLRITQLNKLILTA